MARLPAPVWLTPYALRRSTTRARSTRAHFPATARASGEPVPQDDPGRGDRRGAGKSATGDPAITLTSQVFDSLSHLPYTPRLWRVKEKLVLLTGLGVLWLAASASAHHSFVVEYDVSRPLKLTGVVTKFEWVSPHAFLARHDGRGLRRKS